MKPKKYIVPEQDFSFAAEIFQLTGEKAIQTERAPNPFQAEPLELFVDQIDHARGRAALRAELEFAP